MEFDKTKVYTSVNAEDLPIGSKCIFANNLNDLRHEVLVRRGNFALQKVLDDSYDLRFVVGVYTYSLAYLIEPPIDQKEPEYKPFSNMENLKKAAVKCIGFIKSKQGTREGIIIGISFDNRVIIKKRYGLEYLTIVQLFERYTFDNGTPCGELVEE